MLVFYKLSNRTSIIIGIIFALLCFVFGREIISVFTSDKELINILNSLKEQKEVIELELQHSDISLNAGGGISVKIPHNYNY